MAKVIVVVRKENSEEPTWWLAEGDPCGEESLRIVEPFPEVLKGAWKQKLIDYLNESAPWIIWFDEQGRTAGISAIGRELIFDNN